MVNDSSNRSSNRQFIKEQPFGGRRQLDLHIDTGTTNYTQETSFFPVYHHENDQKFVAEQPLPVPNPHKALKGLVQANDFYDGPVARLGTPPSLSPSTLSPSPLSFSPLPKEIAGSAPAGAHGARLRQCIPRNKSTVTRRARSLATSPQKLSSKSWEHLQSPAASFLSRFTMSSAKEQSSDDDDIQSGDEIDDYVFEKQVGCGGFGTVWRGYSISTGEKVAIKVIKAALENSSEHKRIERELAIWKSLSHPNVVQVHKIIDTDTATYVVSDYCAGGSLFDVMKKRKDNFSEDEARAIFVQLCSGMAYLHDRANVCHKDLKLENVLLDENNNVKICDFGLAVPRSLSTDDEVAGGSLAYAAPEQVLSPFSIACPKTDIWSLGVVLYVLVTSQLPFQDDYDPRLQQKIIKGQHEVPCHLTPELQQLLRGLLCVNPRERYTIQQVLRSAWCCA